MSLSMHVRGVEGEDLLIDKLDDGEVSFTVIYHRDGEFHQIDFSTLSPGDVRDLIAFLQSGSMAAAHQTTGEEG